MNERDLNYEWKFRVYLFKGDKDRYESICRNLNVKPNFKGVEGHEMQ